MQTVYCVHSKLKSVDRAWRGVANMSVSEEVKDGERDLTTGEKILLGAIAVGGTAMIGYMGYKLCEEFTNSYTEYTQAEVIPPKDAHIFYDSSKPSRGWVEAPRQSADSDSDEDEEKQEESVTMRQCVVCMDKERNVYIEPCAHFCMCCRCAKRLAAGIAKQCPVCNTKISKLKQCFYS